MSRRAPSVGVPQKRQYKRAEMLSVTLLLRLVTNRCCCRQIKQFFFLNAIKKGVIFLHVKNNN